MKHYTDIFIDFDDTLYDTHGNAIIALKELFQLYQWTQYFDNPDDFYRAYWKHNVVLWEQYAQGQIDKETLIIERFKLPLSSSPHITDKMLTKEYCMEVSKKFLHLNSTKTKVVEGASELLTYLQQKGYKLHLCSNGFGEVQYKKMEASKLSQFFHTIILSEDAGANKPSPRFFDYAFEKTIAQQETTIIIGDNYHTDIVGGMKAGIDTIFFNRWDKSFIPLQTPTYIIEELREVMNFL